MWWHLATACVGIWLIGAPGVFDFGRPAATVAWIIGPVVASCATIAMWGATRPVRWVNVVLGGCLVVAPFVVTHPLEAALNSLVCGPLIAGLSLVRGRIRHRFGGGWLSVFRGGTEGRRRPVPRQAS